MRVLVPVTPMFFAEIRTILGGPFTDHDVELNDFAAANNVQLDFVTRVDRCERLEERCVIGNILFAQGYDDVADQ